MSGPIDGGAWDQPGKFPLQSLPPTLRYPGWPEWLTPEYSALHTRIENSIKRGTQSVYDSSDAAGMDWTADGMLSCQASRVLNDLREVGWVPPAQAMEPVESFPAPADFNIPDMWACERCDGDTYELIEVERIDAEETTHVCESCRDELMSLMAMECRRAREDARNLETLKSWSTPNTTAESIAEFGGYLEQLVGRATEGDPKQAAIDSLRTFLRVSIEAVSA